MRRTITRVAAVRGVLFDLDDTLADLSAVERVVQPDVAAAVTSLVAAVDAAELARRYDTVFDLHWGRYLESETDFRTYRWNALSAALSPWCELDDVLYDAYRAAKAAQVVHLRPYADAVDTLRLLRAAGLRVGVLTNGPSAFQRRKLAITGLDGEVDAVAVSEELGIAKPAAEAFHAACAMLGVAPGQAAMVGDSPAYDVAGAIRAGLAASVWLHRGPGPARELAGAVVVGSLADVPAALGL